MFCFFPDTLYKKSSSSAEYGSYKLNIISFLQQLDKVYNETDPNIDRQERDEEMERMREHVLKTVSWLTTMIWLFFLRKVIIF